MFWSMFFVTLGFCGTAVLGVLAVRVGLEVRRFTIAVGDGSERITRAAEDLERAAEPLAGHAARTAERTAEHVAEPMVPQQGPFPSGR